MTPTAGRVLADVETYLRGVARCLAVTGQLGARGYTADRFVQVRS